LALRFSKIFRESVEKELSEEIAGGFSVGGKEIKGFAVVESKKFSDPMRLS